MPDPVDPNVTEEIIESAPAETIAETTPVSTEAPTVPIDRLNEVIGERNSLREQFANYQQALYDANLKLQRIEAEREAERRFAQKPVNQSPAEIQEEQAKKKLEGLIASSVSPVIQSQIAALQSQFAPLTEFIEDTKRSKFWTESKNAALPDKLKTAAEAAYMQYKNQIPNLTREMTLQFAKGALFDEMNTATRTQAENSKTALANVNRIALQTTAGPGATGKVPKADNEKKAADLDSELRAWAQANNRS